MELYDIHIYELLRARLGEKETESLIKSNPALRKAFKPSTRMVATKEDIAMLKADIANAKTEILKWMLLIFLTLGLALLGLYLWF